MFERSCLFRGDHDTWPTMKKSLQMIMKGSDLWEPMGASGTDKGRVKS